MMMKNTPPLLVILIDMWMCGCNMVHITSGKSVRSNSPKKSGWVGQGGEGRVGWGGVGWGGAGACAQRVGKENIIVSQRNLYYFRRQWTKQKFKTTSVSIAWFRSLFKLRHRTRH